jgi:hypothetical protein
VSEDSYMYLHIINKSLKKKKKKRKEKENRPEWIQRSGYNKPQQNHPVITHSTSNSQLPLGTPIRQLSSLQTN